MISNRTIKFLSILIALILVIGLFTTDVAIAESWTCSSCASVSTGNFCSNCGAKKPDASISNKSTGVSNNLALNIAFEQNLFFSTYDVDVFLDGVKITTMKHGKAYTSTTSVSEGKHNLKFVNKDDSSVFGEVYFNVSGNTTYECMIHCKYDGVEIDNIQINGTEADSRIKLGESGSVKSVTVNFNGFKESNGSSFLSPSNGNTFVVFDLEIINQSSSEISISTLMSFNAYCDDYAVESSFSAILACDNPLDVTVASGKKAKGQIAFEVPKNWKIIEMEFTPSLWSDDKLTFVIGK